MIKKFVIQICIFLIPVVIGYALVENYTRNLPLTPKIKSDYYKKNKEDIEVLVLGASQNRDAINPEFLSQKTLNIAFPDQDYYVSSRLLEQVGPTLPSLKTVIIPISYGHFETAPNQKDTWKNSMYRHYFGATVSDKFTYFKDNFLYISFPNYYSTKINEHKKGTTKVDCNVYGYNKNIERALFYTHNYDSLTIIKQPIHITPTIPHPEYVSQNVNKLEDILDFCTENKYKIILLETPTTKRFKEQRIPEVLHRKDSVLSMIIAKYNVQHIDANSNNDYNLKDHRDNNHLSTQGAEKFTKLLDKLIN
ncbi:hypothetical protein [uncultured Dokdonia sp.]|uniref:hypothetical protein n=1 Tax=uncultured Dokdonia sp. TaxID=575653 RepID=UPI00261E7D00|nr:hypothetical protein [uncultured Dokdonia sp.]